MDTTSPSPITSREVYETLRDVSDRDKHICFVFGAGASAGYSRNENHSTPPVVAALFDDMNLVVQTVIRYPQHSSILRRRDHITEALTEHGGDLEAYLGHLYARNESNELFTRLILYLQDLFFLSSKNIDLDGRSNNYLRLIYRMDSLRGNEWSCISFNYDTILEKSFVGAGNDPRNFAGLAQYQKVRK